MKIVYCTAAILFTLFFFSAAAQDYRIENNEVKISKSITFKTGTAELLAESDEALLIIKKYLQDKTYISLLRVEAHTDNSGNEAANQLLSQKRAAAICRKLIVLGIDCKRLLPVGFGSTKPLADNGTAEGREQNRRISFVNAALRDRPIGGMPTDGGGKVAENPCD